MPVSKVIRRIQNFFRNLFVKLTRSIAALAIAFALVAISFSMSMDKPEPTFYEGPVLNNYATYIDSQGHLNAYFEIKVVNSMPTPKRVVQPDDYSII